MREWVTYAVSLIPTPTISFNTCLSYLPPALHPPLRSLLIHALRLGPRPYVFLSPLIYYSC